MGDIRWRSALARSLNCDFSSFILTSPHLDLRIRIPKTQSAFPPVHLTAYTTFTCREYPRHARLRTMPISVFCIHVPYRFPCFRFRQRFMSWYRPLNHTFAVSQECTDQIDGACNSNFLTAPLTTDAENQSFLASVGPTR